MMGELNNQDGFEGNERDDIFSKVVRAGKRTYFFDVKATRQNDFYITITESKKRFNQDGKFYFEKHKIFLYKEDFEKFAEGLAEVVDYIKSNKGGQDEDNGIERESDVLQENFSTIDFEDLDKN